jgi:hypothetical protein
MALIALFPEGASSDPIEHLARARGRDVTPSEVTLRAVGEDLGGEVEEAWAWANAGERGVILRVDDGTLVVVVTDDQGESDAALLEIAWGAVDSVTPPRA